MVRSLLGGLSCRPTVRTKHTQAKMRRLGWAQDVAAGLVQIRSMPLEHGCSFFAQQNTLCVSDQELLSYACSVHPGACGVLPPRAHADKCGNAGSGTWKKATIKHFNCMRSASEPELLSACDGDVACSDAIRQFAKISKLHSWAAQEPFKKENVAAWRVGGRHNFMGSDGGCHAAHKTWTTFRQSPRALNFSGGRWIRAPSSTQAGRDMPKWEFRRWEGVPNFDEEPLSRA